MIRASICLRSHDEILHLKGDSLGDYPRSLFELCEREQAQAAKSASQIRAEVQKALSESKKRQEKYERERKAREKEREKAESERQAKPAENETSRPSLIPSKLRYNLTRGQQFAWNVDMRTPAGNGQFHWGGDVYAIVMYGNDSGPAEVMVIGHITCQKEVSGRWIRKEEEDILFGGTHADWDLTEFMILWLLVKESKPNEVCHSK